ncbi:hypothetical protein G6F47_011874 [Rhizopus delemar]|nr:hypothetical protein G6F54_011169 [Rhizopus delemar]KAG1541273.1 hypothetical protein G6F49_011926 [Rhizopus delemar]KAG1583890.1 hypothetical protein G6F47_011874 [Rhizopus delemar]KAG1584583.1 hypothetical protein G6F48_007806 [Rhizopus delemar]KAG1639609.1 hypothetical protein G6F44_007664 [Rhizopus delemar]
MISVNFYAAKIYLPTSLVCLPILSTIAPHSEAVNRILQGEQPTAHAPQFTSRHFIGCNLSCTYRKEPDPESQECTHDGSTRRGLSGGRSHAHLAYVWAMSDDQAQV